MGMRVQAKDLGRTYSGYYGDVRRRPGDQFELTDPKHFSDTWMEKAVAKPKQQVSEKED